MPACGTPAEAKEGYTAQGGQEMSIKVTLLNGDEILGAIIRALAVQAAGFQVVGGMNAVYLKAHGYYRFKFNPKQFHRFQSMVSDYIPEQFRNQIQITEE